MLFLLNLLFALLAFFGFRYIMLDVGAPKPIAIITGLIMAVVIFFLDIAGKIA